MKKIISIIGVFIIFTSPFFAQKNFEGVIKYMIEYDNLPKEMAEYKDMMPTEMVMKIKGNKSRSEQRGITPTISIANGDKGSITMLMDMMGIKIAMEIGDEQKKIDPPKIIYHNETKEIANYSCKKAEVIFDDVKGNFIVYYTDQIQQLKTAEGYDGLKGFPMQYEIKSEGIALKRTATEVIEEKVSDDEFIIPPEYQKMTKEELQKMIGH